MHGYCNQDQQGGLEYLDVLNFFSQGASPQTFFQDDWE